MPALVALAVASVPLLLATGRNFEYEYWLIATAAYGCYALAFLPAAAPLKPRLALAFLAPLLTLAFGWLWRLALSCPCSPGEFFVWWLWQFLPSALAFYALGLLLAALRTKAGWRRWQASLLGLGIAAAPLLLLWFFPQKRLVSLFIGYIHGPIYDRLIPFALDQQLQRLGGALIALALICAAGLPLRRFAQAFALGISLSLAGSLSTVGTGHGHSALQSQLSAAIHGDGFTLWYSPAKEAKAAKGVSVRIQQLAQEAAFHIKDLTAELKLSAAPKVAIYVYPDRLSKKTWFGGLTTDVTDVYSPSIHITADRFPHGTLRHELVHALTSGVGFWGLGFHPNMAITEGLAVYLAPQLSTFSLHTEAATITKMFWQGDVAGLFGPMFWSYSGARAYRVAGSLLHYLTEQYGSEAVMALYRGESFSGAFGRSRQQVVADWLQRLETTYDPLYDDILRNRFAYGGILTDTCPHSKASARFVSQRQNASLASSWWWQLRGGDWRAPKAAPVRGAGLLAPLPDTEGATLRANSEAITAAFAGDSQMGKGLGMGLRLRLRLRQVSLYELLGEREKAAEALRRASELPGTKPAGLARLQALLTLMAKQPSMERPTHAFLLTGDTKALAAADKGPLAAGESDSFAKAYLRLRNAPNTVDSCGEHRLPGGQPYVLARAWYQQQLRCLYRHQSAGWQAAAQAIATDWQQLAPPGSEDHRALAIDIALLQALQGSTP